MDCVKNGSIQITDEDLPSFLYKSETAYNEENEDMGLFCGFLLVHDSMYITTFLLVPPRLWTLLLRSTRARQGSSSSLRSLEEQSHMRVSRFVIISPLFMSDLFLLGICTLAFHPWANGACLTIFSTSICFMIISWPCLKRIWRIPGWSKLSSGWMSRSQSCFFFRS